MAQVKLLGAWGSPFSRRVEMALKLKGIEYEYVEQDLANKSQLLLECNPVHKKVPVLVHNGKPIAESLVILEYVEETWKERPIMPQHPYDRAMARFWAKFIDEKCNGAIWSIVYAKGEARERAIEEASQHLETLENELKGKKFFGGETIGVVDIVGNFLAWWLGVVEESIGVELVNEHKFPLLCRWRDDFVNNHVIKQNLPPRDDLLTAMKPRLTAPSWKY